MTYFTAKIRARTVHIGYDDQGQLIKQDLPVTDFVEKVIRLDRILSFTEDHLFVACPHDTVQVWDYEGGLDDVQKRLQAAGVVMV